MKKQQTKPDQVKKDPLIRLVKRDALPVWKVIIIYAIAILSSLLLSSVICSLFSPSNKAPMDFFANKNPCGYPAGRKTKI